MLGRGLTISRQISLCSLPAGEGGGDAGAPAYGGGGASNHCFAGDVYVCHDAYVEGGGGGDGGGGAVSCRVLLSVC